MMNDTHYTKPDIAEVELCNSNSICVLPQSDNPSWGYGDNTLPDLE